MQYKSIFGVQEMMALYNRSVCLSTISTLWLEQIEQIDP